jgi:uncharacterized membrane protein (UPF0127 family)
MNYNMENLQKEYEGIIKDDFFMKKQKLNELAKEILPQVGIDDPDELTNLLVQELVEDVSEEDSKVIFDNLENYKDLLIEFINSQLDEVKSYGEGGVFEVDPELYEITVSGDTYKVLIVQTEEEKEQGLQGVESLEPDEGMLFDYSEELPTELSFWMKDTLVPLDIIFINEKGIVIQVSEGEPLSEEAIVCSGQPIMAVLELLQNSGIKEGDAVELAEELNIDEEPEETKEIEEVEEELQEDFDAENDEGFDEALFPELKPNVMYILGSDGTPQGELQGNERIFSRIHTRALIKKAKRAYASRRKKKEYEALCIALGKNMFKCLQIQSETPAEYVEN